MAKKTMTLILSLMLSTIPGIAAANILGSVEGALQSEGAVPDIGPAVAVAAANPAPPSFQLQNRHYVGRGSAVVKTTLDPDYEGPKAAAISAAISDAATHCSNWNGKIVKRYDVVAPFTVSSLLDYDSIGWYSATAPIDCEVPIQDARAVEWPPQTYVFKEGESNAGVYRGFGSENGNGSVEHCVITANQWRTAYDSAEGEARNNCVEEFNTRCEPFSYEAIKSPRGCYASVHVRVVAVEGGAVSQGSGSRGGGASRSNGKCWVRSKYGRKPQNRIPKSNERCMTLH